MGIRLEDPVVNNVNLTVDPLAIDESPVKRVLGMNDMYQDTAQPTKEQQRHIEELFGKLESEASRSFHKIVKAVEDGDPSLQLTRGERNRIRKFLFLLKYRGSGFHRRYSGSIDAAGYDYDDQEQLREYMRERGFERRVDVWFDNIKTFANLKMDAENKWMAELLDKVYPADARWLINHVQQMYMAICTPADASDEFTLTDDSYNVFEGVEKVMRDPETGRLKGHEWINFHEFAPVSPKVMIVLRTCAVPVSEEDVDSEDEEASDLWQKAVVDHFGPSTESSLADLPICKARNSYSQVIDGRAIMDNEDRAKQLDDKFYFTFFRFSTHHVDRINGFLLDNAHNCTRIVFQSRNSFQKTLEWYMTEPCQYGKRIVGADAEAKLKLLKGLAGLLRSMGSSAKPVWDESFISINGALSDSEKKRLGSEKFKEIIESHFKSQSDGQSRNMSQQPDIMLKYASLGILYVLPISDTILTNFYRRL